ncbi:MAG: hypothetical protein O2951_17730 [Bacteroidetes bacterium]|nr:hypothetical protein [Bacteroidota bacterium]
MDSPTITNYIDITQYYDILKHTTGKNKLTEAVVIKENGLLIEPAIFLQFEMFHWQVLQNKIQIVDS